MSDFGLSAKDKQLIQDILAKFANVEKAVIYGSRAKGNFRKGSDIDLALFGDQLTWKELSQISSNLEDTSLPYTFDLSLYQTLTKSTLQEHIDRVGKVFYQRQASISEV